MIELRTNRQRDAARSRIEADSLSIMSEHGATMLEKNLSYDRIVFLNLDTTPQMLRYEEQTLSSDRKDDDLPAADVGNHAEPLSRQLQMRARISVERFLARHDYEILSKAFASEHGEIDIVALDPKYEGDIVFVDVRVREGEMPSECITEGTMERARAMAVDWLKTHPAMTGSPRFDIISLAVLDGDQAYIRHHIAAFDGQAGALSEAR